MNALCTASSRPVRDPTTRGESCGFVDESFGPARALWAVWTANAHALSTALPTLSRLSPTSSTGPTTGDSQNKHRTTLRRGCLHRPFKTTSASHSNRSQHRPRAGSPPTLQAHFRMGLDSQVPTGDTPSQPSVVDEKVVPLRGAKEQNRNASCSPFPTDVPPLFGKRIRVPPPKLTPADIEHLKRRFLASTGVE